MFPRRPTSIDPRAASLLDWMGAQPWAHHIVLGGAFALKHYLDYRDTHDCDAWWGQETRTEERDPILAEIEVALRFLNPGFDLRRRRWGDTDSVELRQDNKTVFSFQISQRTFWLSEQLGSDWGTVRIESLKDNVASKMSALTGRGAPRDYLDIFQIAHSLSWDRERLWALWVEKNPGQLADEARLLVRVNLEAIAARRPSEQMPPAQRREVEKVRMWFFDSFLK